MKYLSLSLLFTTSFLVSMQSESFAEYIKKCTFPFYQLRNNAKNQFESNKFAAISLDDLKADLERNKEKYGRDLLQVTDWNSIYNACSELSHGARNHKESEELRSVQKELVEFCDQARNAQEFLRKYAPEKLNN